MKPPARLTKTQLPPKTKMNGLILLLALAVPRNLARWIHTGTSELHSLPLCHLTG